MNDTLICTDSLAFVKLIEAHSTGGRRKPWKKGFLIDCPVHEGRENCYVQRKGAEIRVHCFAGCDSESVASKLKDTLNHIQLKERSEALNREAEKTHLWLQQCGRIARKPEQNAGGHAFIKLEHVNPQWTPGENPPSTDSAVKSTDDKILEKVANAGYVLAAAIEALTGEIKRANDLPLEEEEEEREAIQAVEQSEQSAVFPDETTLPF